MHQVKTIFAARLTRFVVVGLGNTALNFLVLNFAFYALHQSKLRASLIATSCAVALSFVLNRNFVFMDKTRPLRQLVLFVLVTVGGVLVVQNSVYALGIAALRGHEAWLLGSLRGIGLHVSRDFVDINLSNCLASLVVMVWNYNGYRWLVFKGETHGAEPNSAEVTA